MTLRCLTAGRSLCSMADTEDHSKQAPNSRKGIPKGKSKHYGDRDERFTLDMDPEEAVGRLVERERPAT